ncbi:MAG: 7-carboxy-7-deazaguanine synthase QueE [Tannerellaceae bacterium]|jgi:7-carboxy-7-deazaguanine synthase|nr:7-carboxy-7-deazaguanine synthase QueE [Tannerellaceae bacterium]
MKTNICEIYPCLQGEGSRAGTPSILIRTSGCNLRCRWCDTPYTSWQPEEGIYNTEDVLFALNANTHIEDVIITGGEPTLCRSLGEIIELCVEKGKRITLETNATQLIAENLMRAVDLVSLSPKLSNSSPAEKAAALRHDTDRIRISVIRKWIESAADYHLKFVVSDPGDIREINELIEESGIERRNIYLMPEGRTEKELQQKRLWLADLCIREGFRYCERLHIIIYGDKRGV